MSERMSIWDIYSQYIRRLPASDRAALIALIADGMIHDVPSDPPTRLTIDEIESLSQEERDEIDPQEYVTALRDEWDEPPREFR